MTDHDAGVSIMVDDPVNQLARISLLIIQLPIPGAGPANYLADSGWRELAETIRQELVKHFGNESDFQWTEFQVSEPSGEE
jgi:hypothetical protein